MGLQPIRESFAKSCLENIPWICPWRVAATIYTFDGTVLPW